MIKAPNGRLSRQLPEEHVWTTQRWITKKGDVYRRRWRPIEKNWKWDEEPVQLSLENDTGKIGLYNPWFISLEYALACTWRKRAEDSSDLVTLQEGKPLQARYLKFSKEESRKEEEPTDVEQETWKPLKWTIGPVTCDPTYEISNLGRLKAPSGKITKGFLFRSRRWAAVRNCGLVDLGSASKIQSKDMPPMHIQTAKDAMLSGHSPSDLAEITGISLKTAWTYFYEALTWTRKKELKRVWRDWLPSSLCNELYDARHQPIIGASLTDLLDFLHTRLPPEFFEESRDLQYGQLRFGRAAVLALL